MKTNCDIDHDEHQILDIQDGSNDIIFGPEEVGKYLVNFLWNLKCEHTIRKISRSLTWTIRKIFSSLTWKIFIAMFTPKINNKSK